MSFLKWFEKPRDFLEQPLKNLKAKFDHINHIEEQRLTKAQLLNYDEIDDTFPWSLEFGNKAFQLGRNRYKNILPFDHNRIQLKSSVDDYINASKISIGDREYIATQGPINGTIAHFWAMISQLPDDECVIVMLTPLMEGKRVKCAKYWVDEREYIDFKGDGDGAGFDSDLRLLGEIQVQDYHGINGLIYTRSKLEIIKKDNKNITKKKTIHHLYYTNWSDFDKPNDWEAIYKLCLITDQLGSYKPSVVHCSAGAGRTGTFITLDYFFHNEELLKKDDDDPIYKTVLELRTQRMSLVQSFEQFQFLYDALRKYRSTQFKT